MALSVAVQQTTTVAAETPNQLVIGAEPSRRGLQIQLLDEGFLWVGLNIATTKDAGFRVGKGELVDLTLAFASIAEASIDFFDGPVLAYYEPGVDPGTGQPRTEARIRVLSMQ